MIEAHWKYAVPTSFVTDVEMYYASVMHFIAFENRNERSAKDPVLEKLNELEKELAG